MNRAPFRPYTFHESELETDLFISRDAKPYKCEELARSSFSKKSQLSHPHPVSRKMGSLQKKIDHLLLGCSIDWLAERCLFETTNLMILRINQEGILQTDDRKIC